jgi:hypothetical protein
MQLRSKARHQRRLDDPNDFVRIEIGAALQRDIPVILILVEGARVPRPDQLPEDIRELAFRNALDVRHKSFHSDMNKLVDTLKLILEARRPASTQQQATPKEHSQVAQTPSLQAPVADPTAGEHTGAQPPTLEMNWLKAMLEKPLAPAVAWAVVSAANIACQLYLIELLVRANPSLVWEISETKMLAIQLVSLLLAGIGAFLLATVRWLRTQSRLVMAVWIGFFSALVAVYCAWLVTLTLRGELFETIAVITAVHIGTSFLQWPLQPPVAASKGEAHAPLFQNIGPDTIGLLSVIPDW